MGKGAAFWGWWRTKNIKLAKHVKEDLEILEVISVQLSLKSFRISVNTPGVERDQKLERFGKRAA